MTKSEIINELKQCKGNRAALEFAVTVVSDMQVTCRNCKFEKCGINDFPCSVCNVIRAEKYWEAKE